MGYRPVWNIWQIRSLGCGRRDSVESVDINGRFGTPWFKGVDVDGCINNPLGGGERGGMTDTSLQVCSIHVCSSVVKSFPCVSIHSCISIRVNWCLHANSCNF